MSIRDFLHRLRTTPLKGIWRRLKKRARQAALRIHVRISEAPHERLSIRKDLIAVIPDESSLIRRIQHGPYPVFFIDSQTKDRVAQQIRGLFPAEEKNILRAAELACQHIFDLLGSGACSLGENIDWQADFKSGHRWNVRGFYLDMRPAPSPGGYEIKVPWELSRCQHFAWLGQAYWLDGNEGYPREFARQVEHWIACNPPSLGVNWSSAMDVAIRAVNWLWGYAFFRGSTALSDEFHLHFYRSMLEHGRHITSNVEYSEMLTSNHYLSNLVGLVFLGYLLPELREAKAWRDFGLRELETEMFKQVYPDGVDFEASTSYHRLVTELFLSATLLARLNGHVFGDAYMHRLEKMVEYILYITQPDGTVPLIGDNDNGRLHRLKMWDPPDREWVDFRYLLAIGAVLFNRLDFAVYAGDQWEEAVWLQGEKALEMRRRALSGAQDPVSLQSRAFPDGGVYIIRDRTDCMIIDAGSQGQNGIGGHAHNDTLSFVLNAQEVSWFVDPGTYTYTQDYEARQLFRSTAFHNVVQPDGLEQNLSTSRQPFRMEKCSEVTVQKWVVESAYILFQGQCRFAGLANIIHQRTIVFDLIERVWLIKDLVSGVDRNCRLYLHPAPGIEISKTEDLINGFTLQSPSGMVLCVGEYGHRASATSVKDSWFSPGYGARQESKVLVWDWSAQVEHYLAFGVENIKKPFADRLVTARQNLAPLIR